MRDKSVAPFFVGLRVDAQGGVLPSAQVTLSSPALIGGPANSVTNEKGQLRFQATVADDVRRAGLQDLGPRRVMLGVRMNLGR